MLEIFIYIFKTLYLLLKTFFFFDILFTHQMRSTRKLGLIKNDIVRKGNYHNETNPTDENERTQNLLLVTHVQIYIWILLLVEK